MFLQITDKYAIESDANSWAISLKRIQKSKGEYFEGIAWYTSLEGAVNGLAQMMIRSSDAQTLDDALKDVEKVVYSITKSLEPNFKITTKE